MHLPNPLPHNLYRGQMFAYMVNKHPKGSWEFRLSPLPEGLVGV